MVFEGPSNANCSTAFAAGTSPRPAGAAADLGIGCCAQRHPQADFYLTNPEEELMSAVHLSWDVNTCFCVYMRHTEGLGPSVCLCTLLRGIDEAEEARL